MKIIFMFILFVLTCLLTGFFFGLLERQKTMNGVANLKIIGRAVMEYKSRNQSYPMGYTIGEMMEELQFDEKKLRSFSIMDLHSCIYLKGELWSETDCILLWRSGIRRNYYFGKKYYLELKLFEDGHVSGTKIYL